MKTSPPLHAVPWMLLALYRETLRAFPPDVRDSHRIEMLETFEALLNRRRAARGRAAMWVLGLRVVSDAVVNGTTERVRRITEGMSMRAMLGDLARDGRQAIRSLLRTPGQAAVLVGTLALGIGATTAIFSVLNAVMFAALPYEEPEELIVIRHRLSNLDNAPLVAPGLADLPDYIAGTSTIAAVGGIQALETNLNLDDRAVRVTAGWTTPDFFQVIGGSAQLGRVLQASDWVGADRSRMEDPTFTPPPMAVLLAHGLWQSHFGGDPGVLGRSVRLNGQSMHVIGVLPEGFRLHLPHDADMPTVLDAYVLVPVPMSTMGRGAGGARIIARLADGASIESARAELMTVAESLRRDHEVHTQYGTEVVVQPLHDQVVGDARGVLWIVFGTVILLLLIACTNVASLLLVRATSREREFSIRAALGAGRGRVLRQLLTESMVIAAMGTAVGLVVARWGLQGFVAARPDFLPRLDTVSLDPTVLAFAIVISVAVAVTFGFAPALFSVRADGHALMSGRGTGAGGRASVRTRTILIVAQLAISVVLVVGAGLLVRSFVAMQRVDLGFDPEGVVAVDVAVPFFSYRDDAVRSAFFVRLAERASALADVTAAGVTARLPLEPGSGGTWTGPVGPAGASLTTEEGVRVRYRALTPGALDAMGVRLHAGRTLMFGDERSDAAPVVVVDTRFEETVMPEGALGSTITIVVAAYTGNNRTVEARIVGVTEPVRFTSVTEADEPTIFLPYRYYAPVDGTVIMRTQMSPGEAATAVTAIVAELDRSVPVYSQRRFRTIVSQASSQARYTLVLVATFAGGALMLAAVGLYGVIATLVQQRTREIGLRVALGANDADIRRMVTWDSLRMVIPGLVLGFGGAIVAAPAVRSLTYGIEPTDTQTFAGAALLLGLVALLAAIGPAQRAARVDPVRALREE